MSIRKRKIDLLASALDRERDNILSGDEEFFRQEVEPYIPMLRKAARKSLARHKWLQKTGVLQPEELVGETLIHAWDARHGRGGHRKLEDWLLAKQEDVLRQIINDERRMREAIVVSLEAPLSSQMTGQEESGDGEWTQPPIQDCWKDIIPDERAALLAA
jgi:DNA-directed RNA polymerase specialized sigma24 family protein